MLHNDNDNNNNGRNVVFIIYYTLGNIHHLHIYSYINVLRKQIVSQTECAVVGPGGVLHCYMMRLV